MHNISCQNICVMRDVGAMRKTHSKNGAICDLERYISMARPGLL